MFHDYLEQFDARHMRNALIELFRVLDQKPEERDPHLSDDDPILAGFPYVNGGLFRNEAIEIPPITDEIRKLILVDGSENFDWSEISPTIFGAVFESTLNPETRRKGGMHYTSIENIHKVINPLFLDELKEELEEIQKITVVRTKRKKLEDFQEKLASLKFLDKIPLTSIQERRYRHAAQDRCFQGLSDRFAICREPLFFALSPGRALWQSGLAGGVCI